MIIRLALLIFFFRHGRHPSPCEVDRIVALCNLGYSQTTAAEMVGAAA